MQTSMENRQDRLKEDEIGGLISADKVQGTDIYNRRGDNLGEVENVMIDKRSGKELARFDISDSGSHTGLILASLSRNGGQWDFKAIGERTGGRTVHDLTAPARAIL